MKKPAYDFYEKKIRKETAERFRKLCEVEEAETPKEQETLRINTDYTSECVDRRIRATSRYLSKAEECFKTFMPFAKAKDLFFRFNTLPFSSQAYGSEDFKETVSLAASIWILDQLLVQAQLCEGGSLPHILDPYLQESDYSKSGEPLPHLASGVQRRNYRYVLCWNTVLWRRAFFQGGFAKQATPKPKTTCADPSGIY